MQRYEVARITVQQRRNQKRSEKIVRRGRGHRRTETLSVTAHSLAISVQRIPRLTHRCSGGRTEKTRRGDALIRKKFKLLSGAQRTPAGGNLGKENRPPSENVDGWVAGIMVVRVWARRLCVWRIGRV